MKVIRSMPEEGWVPIANSTAQNRHLSWRAKGLLLDLLSFPNGYHITIEKLLDLAKRAGDPDVEGEHALRRALKELERKGYVAHVRSSYKDETSDRVLWRTETQVCDLPGAVSVRPGGFPGPGVSGLRSVRDAEDPGAINNTGFYNNEQQDEADQSTAALAAARAGQQARDEIPAQLLGYYDAADQLDDETLRRLLLAVETKRPGNYRKFRQRAMAQLDREHPGLSRSPRAARDTDLLSYKYALQHYDQSENGLPQWLIRLPRQRRAA